MTTFGRAAQRSSFEVLACLPKSAQDQYGHISPGLSGFGRHLEIDVSVQNNWRAIVFECDAPSREKRAPSGCAHSEYAAVVASSENLTPRRTKIEFKLLNVCEVVPLIRLSSLYVTNEEDGNVEFLIRSG
jgi:hypothetical protein